MTDVVDEIGEEPTAWRLVVEEGELVARRSVPYDGVLRFTTEEYPHGRPSHRKRSEFGLDVETVVARYVAHADPDADETTLLARARRQLSEARGRVEPERSERATFGGGESTGVQEL